MIVSYLTYCVEVWGIAWKTYTNSVFILQKRAMRIVSRSRYRHLSNPLIVQLKLFQDLVDNSILQIMYEGHKRILPANIQRRFEKRESHYIFKGTEISKKRKKTKNEIQNQSEGTFHHSKRFSLWNNFNSETKESKTKQIC